MAGSTDQTGMPDVDPVGPLHEAGKHEADEEEREADHVQDPLHVAMQAAVEAAVEQPRDGVEHAAPAAKEPEKNSRPRCEWAGTYCEKCSSELKPGRAMCVPWNETTT